MFKSKMGGYYITYIVRALISFYAKNETAS